MNLNITDSHSNLRISRDMSSSSLSMREKSPLLAPMTLDQLQDLKTRLEDENSQLKK